jgi:hypothetical protein
MLRLSRKFGVEGVYDIEMHGVIGYTWFACTHLTLRETQANTRARILVCIKGDCA